ncbi:hypothetical protein [Aeromicrobium wangtongii]|uniref:Excreted virulence factor EspC, type VII ESX diderm n=1 Tax=Aeromicrobium wangtongii TaxID=2969247 RepID=A0ABY5M9P8_9ACTN|nr:hypothetical protein [Aeromicrobium wangtongii]MCD9199318.1 hypothetical protein [Aeromicrobium wangtongii]UUP13679.1 hypothetical protein NQV15_17790 [Aeromicrobium wangtongii]
MGDLEVATTELRGLSKKLAGLSKDMTDNDGKVEYTRAQLGHSAVVGAMDTFHSNWDHNRDYVCGKLDTLGELAEQAADGFEETDEDLARQIAEVMEK